MANKEVKSLSEGGGGEPGSLRRVSPTKFIDDPSPSSSSSFRARATSPHGELVRLPSEQDVRFSFLPSRDPWHPPPYHPHRYTPHRSHTRTDPCQTASKSPTCNRLVPREHTASSREGNHTLPHPRRMIQIGGVSFLQIMGCERTVGGV